MTEHFVGLMHVLAKAGAEGHGKEAKPPLPVMGMGALYLAVIIAIGIVILLNMAREGYAVRGPKTALAKLAEHAYLFLDRLALSVIGPHGRQFMPFLTTMWLMIFCGNIVGLVLHITPTANMSFNLGMSLITVFYVQAMGIGQNGFFKHFAHFAGPKLPASMFYVTGLIFSVELISELAKILSLALRLFGNIAGGGLVVKNLDHLSEYLGASFEVPIGSILIPIKLLTAILQPFVWVMLTCVYLGAVTHHHEHHEDHHGDDHGHAPAPAH